MFHSAACPWVRGGEMRLRQCARVVPAGLGSSRSRRTSGQAAGRVQGWWQRGAVAHMDSSRWSWATSMQGWAGRQRTLFVGVSVTSRALAGCYPTRLVGYFYSASSPGGLGRFTCGAIQGSTGAKAARLMPLRRPDSRQHVEPITLRPDPPNLFGFARFVAKSCSSLCTHPHLSRHVLGTKRGPGSCAAN